MMSQLWLDFFEAAKSLRITDFQALAPVIGWILFLLIPIKHFDLNDHLTQWTYIAFMSMVWTFLFVMFSPGEFEKSPGDSVLFFGAVCLISGLRWSVAPKPVNSQFETKLKLHLESTRGNQKTKN